MERLKSRPHVEPEQDKATSSLLSHRRTTITDRDSSFHDISISEPYRDEQRAFTGYDDDDVHALHGIARENEQNRTVLWKGLPHYLLTWELLGISLSLCFLALGACVASLEDQPETAWSIRVIQASNIAPSIWPIAFSGVLGNAMRAFADYKVERGVSLMGLEQLLGSVTMASSIITVFRWSIFRVSSVAIIFLWIFNPLGSQASFRGAYLRAKTGTSQGNITYYSPDLSVQLDLCPFVGGSRPFMRPLYSTSLYDNAARTQYVDVSQGDAKSVVTMSGGESFIATLAAMDTWGNIRIPALQNAHGYDPDRPHRWVKTPWDQKILNYSSLLGDRVEGINLKSVSNTTFTLESSYQSYKCIPWFGLNNTAPSRNTTTGRNVSDADIWLVQNTGKTYRSHVLPNYTRRSTLDRTFFVSHSRAVSIDGLPHYLPKIVFASASRNATRLIVTTCTARTMYVQANVTCISKGESNRANCGVNALREMPNPPADPAEAILNHWTESSYSFIDFMDTLDIVRAGSEYSSNIENYLYNPLYAFSNSDGKDLNVIVAAEAGNPNGGGSRSGSQGASSGDSSKVALNDVSIETFERRFSLLWNTLWKIGWASKTVMGGGFDFAGPHMVRHDTSDITFPLPDVYAINRAWMAVYFVSVAVMFVAAVFSLVVHSLCRAPPILGFASSLIRDYTYFEDCGVNLHSVEDGPEKSRRLGKMRIMVADVHSGKSEAGKIAFAPIGMGNRVEKGRWYE